MNLTEYRERAKAIRRDAELEVKKLARDYAFSNSSVKVGDVIKSKLRHNQTILVDKINFTLKTFMAHEESPECVYVGRVLTKKGEPRKDGEIGRIYHSDLLIEK